MDKDRYPEPLPGTLLLGLQCNHLQDIHLSFEVTLLALSWYQRSHYHQYHQCEIRDNSSYNFAGSKHPLLYCRCCPNQHLSDFQNQELCKVLIFCLVRLIEDKTYRNLVRKYSIVNRVSRIIQIVLIDGIEFILPGCVMFIYWSLLSSNSSSSLPS